MCSSGAFGSGMVSVQVGLGTWSVQVGIIFYGNEHGLDKHPLPEHTCITKGSNNISGFAVDFGLF